MMGRILDWAAQRPRIGTAATMAVAIVSAFVVLGASVTSHAVGATTASPFPPLAGRWVGQGRLGLKDSPPETVKCRATYFVSDNDNTLKQAIRCATSGGAIEVKGEVKHANGVLTGHWKETMRNLEGDLNGNVTPRGFKISVKSNDISANMDIVVMGNRQIVEIQFHNSSMIGLTLLLTKG